MQDCTYSNDETENGIIHEKCTNEDMKKIKQKTQTR